MCVYKYIQIYACICESVCVECNELSSDFRGLEEAHLHLQAAFNVVCVCVCDWDKERERIVLSCMFLVLAISGLCYCSFHLKLCF